MRTRMSGGVGGVWRGNSRRPYPDKMDYVTLEIKHEPQTGLLL
jgi:hypothetical protein